MTPRTWRPAEGQTWNPLRAWPPNEACFCDSGRKAKKCCLPREPGCVSSTDAALISKALGLGEVGKAAIRAEFRRHRDRAAQPIETPEA